MRRSASAVLGHLLLPGSMLLIGCAVAPPSEDPGVEDRAVLDQGAESLAEAQISPLADREIRGPVTFRNVPGGMRVEARISGLDPNGRHGFHIHDGTECEEPGDHLAPYGHEHGGPDDPRNERHMGDLGNLEANAEGVATYDRVISGVPGEASPSILGHVVIVHERHDDLETDPSGEAGDPLACGVIEPVG